jgi:hypothetical protein
VLVALDRVAMEHASGFGTQTVPPGCHVRDDRNEEVIHPLKGRGRAVNDGVDVPVEEFFRAIGGPRSAAGPAPEPFPPPENVLAIERRAVFALQPADQRKP